MSLIVLPPITMTDAMLVSSSVAEDTNLAWVTGTTYAVGNLRHVVAVHNVYKRLTAGAGTVSPELDPTNWLLVSKTNRWAMFDSLRNTKTVSTSGTMTIVLNPGRRVDSLGLLGVLAQSVTVKVDSGGSTVYTKTQVMQERDTASWYGYYTGAIKQRDAIAMFDLPPFASATITVTITAATGETKLGTLCFGLQCYIGEVEYNAENDATNFSKIERQFDGSLTLIPRQSINKNSLSVVVKSSNVDKVLALRKTLNAVPALWSGLAQDPNSDYYESLLIFGIYRRMPLSITYHSQTKWNVELEEM